jgi:hypothetical protein
LNKALEFVKKHPTAIAGGIVAVIIVIYLISRSSSSSGGDLTGAIASQQAGQLQMAQLNAQLSAQSEQTQAQLEAQEYSGSLAQQEQQDTLAGQVIGTVVPAQLESGLYSQELKNQAAIAGQISGYLPQAFAVTGESNRGVIGEDELALLLGTIEGNSSLVQAAGGLPQSAGTSGGGGFNLSLPGIGSLGASGIG